MRSGKLSLPPVSVLGYITNSISLLSILALIFPESFFQPSSNLLLNTQRSPSPSHPYLSCLSLHHRPTHGHAWPHSSLTRARERKLFIFPSWKTCLLLNKSSIRRFNACKSANRLHHETSNKRGCTCCNLQVIEEYYTPMRSTGRVLGLRRARVEVQNRKASKYRQ